MVVRVQPPEAAVPRAEQLAAAGVVELEDAPVRRAQRQAVAGRAQDELPVLLREEHGGGRRSGGEHPHPAP
jgi:hypothetical protein